MVLFTNRLKSQQWGPKKHNPRKIVEDVLNKAKSVNLCVLKPKDISTEGVLPFVTTFDPPNQELFGNFRETVSLNKCRELKQKCH